MIDSEPELCEAEQKKLEHKADIADAVLISTSDCFHVVCMSIC